MPRVYVTGGRGRRGRRRGKGSGSGSSCLVVVGIFAALVALGFVVEHPWALALVGVAILLVILYFIGRHVQRREAEQRELAKWRGSGINDIDGMSGAALEERIAVMLFDLGYTVEHTGKVGDFGCDLVARMRRTSAVVQAKRYSETVGPAAVQEAHTARTHYQTTEAWVVTNSTFTKAAVTLAASCHVRLIDRHALVKMLDKAARAHETASQPQLGYYPPQQQAPAQGAEPRWPAEADR
jgi:restriction system protein